MEIGPERCQNVRKVGSDKNKPKNIFQHNIFLVFCPYPGLVQNGKILLVGNMGLYDYRPYVKKVANNKQIMYDCEKGYVLAEGPPGATCVGGQWSPRELPKWDV